MSTFLPGLELSRRFYREAVRPIIDAVLGVRPHTAARIGSGSEVLGFDTARSADHEWGPRLEVFLRPEDVRTHAEELSAALAERLPKTFLGYPTNYGPPEASIRVMTPTDGPVLHRVEITDQASWFRHRIGIDPSGPPLTIVDWLGIPTQRLAEITAGAVFHDGLDTLEDARTALGWYPADVWRYVLAGLWQRISQEEAFIGRTGEIGDELGSAIVAARLSRDLMRLCLLMERTYPPYSKWLGSAFGRLPIAAELGPRLRAAVGAATWQEREEALSGAYAHVAERHNRLGLTPPLDTATRQYFDRPFQVIGAARFAEALRSTITDPYLAASTPLLGSCDQYIDSTDALTNPALIRAIAVDVHANFVTI